MFDQICDYCDEWCLAGEDAYYNPTNKLVYHIDCMELAEVG